MTQFKLLLVIILITGTVHSSAQEFSAQLSFLPDRISIAQEAESESFPDPKTSFRRSLIIPGWGQITNKQAWKVPIVYGVIGGLVYYSLYVNDLYKDYRAAYYNTQFDDQKFGPTPAYLTGTSSGNLRTLRNSFHNRRDLVIAGIAVAWILNGVEAYVAAHLRPFDVSDDLSMNTSVKPVVIASAVHSAVPVVSFSFSFNN